MSFNVEEVRKLWEEKFNEGDEYSKTVGEMLEYYIPALDEIERLRGENQRLKELAEYLRDQFTIDGKPISKYGAMALEALGEGK